MAGYPRIILTDITNKFVKSDVSKMNSIKPGKYFLVIPFEKDTDYAELLMKIAHIRPQTPEFLEKPSEYSKELHRKHQILAEILMAMMEAREQWFRTDSEDSLGGLVVKVYLDVIEGMIEEFQKFKSTSKEPVETDEEVNIRQMEEFLEAFTNAEDMWVNRTHWDSIGIRQDKDGTVYFPNAYKRAFLQVARDILDERRKIKAKD